MTHGCHNREPYKPLLLVQDGYNPMSKPDATTRSPKMKQIESFAHGAGCQYTLSQNGQEDAGCDGCKWRHDASA